MTKGLPFGGMPHSLRGQSQGRHTHTMSKPATERAGNSGNGFPSGRNHRILVRSSSAVARLALLGWREPQRPRPTSFHESPLLWDEY